MNSQAIIELKDLRYELQLALGASKIILYIERWDKKQKSDDYKFGNIVNYYKSCAFLHLRNLFNNITNEAETEVGKIHKIESKLYAKWKRPIEKFYLHLNDSRSQKGVSNRISGIHVNTLVPLLTEELIKKWEEWANGNPDLVNILKECQKNANDDLSKFKILHKKIDKNSLFSSTK